MPKWTKEQQQAIDESGKNIIVSAGAGSGKTAVLSERVIKKLEQGVDIDRLLILTFTKAAAFEMMIRIRAKIKERPNLQEQLKKIDAAYITTFDSFSLSLVKKYHYLLNIKRDIQITNENIMKQEKARILEEIFARYYEEENQDFFALLESYTTKEDTELKKAILDIYNKLELKYDQRTFLTSYIHNERKNRAKRIQDFERLLIEKAKELKETLEELSCFVDGDYYASLEEALLPIMNSSTYDELKKAIHIKLSPIPRGTEEEGKKKKENLVKQIDKIKEYLIYEDREEIERLLEDQEKYLQVLIHIFLELEEKITLYKREHSAFEFTDIAKMAISLVQENKEIQEELKNYFEEIMVDEYQDTSDLQETFIQAIANNNVYTVGDIKQSIYRFRNANPYIFKGKYDAYEEKDGGVKIDLMKNFRSRREVLQNINDIFDLVMDDKLGGCNYQKSHRMVFGNTNYEQEDTKQNANFEVYNYIGIKGYTNDEIEAFTIAQDIQEKVASNYQVIDKESFRLRNARFDDFAILMDTAKKFDLYKKIFEYLEIPLNVYKDTNITEEDDIYIINNLLTLIQLAYKKEYTSEFVYAFVSVSRSYLIQMSEEEILTIIQKKSYKESKLMKKIEPILREYPYLNIRKLFEQVIHTFSFYERQIEVGNIKHLIAHITYLKEVFEEMVNLGFSIEEAITSFSKMVRDGGEIKMSFNNTSDNAVKLMTIHKSKGLEFPVLYMAGLSNRFNIKDLNEKFIFDEKHGFIFPFYQEEEKKSINFFTMKENYLEEEVSEKIRLFYVALTRAREKIIMLTNNEKEIEPFLEDKVKNTVKIKYRSFLDILKSIWTNLIPYKRQIDVTSIGLTKNYNLIKPSNYDKTLEKKGKSLTYEEVEYRIELSENLKFSKTTKNLLSQEEKEAIQMGLRFHEIFELIDFNHPDYRGLTAFEEKKVKEFLNQPLLKNIENSKIYKEFEFIDREKEKIKQGMIDLLIEQEDKIIIIDYKLKKVMDQAYIKQLTGYKNYIYKKTNKPIEVYLYSILESKFIEVEGQQVV